MDNKKTDLIIRAWGIRRPNCSNK